MVSAAAAVLLGIAFLQLFKHQPHAMTQATIFSQVLACLHGKTGTAHMKMS